MQLTFILRITWTKSAIYLLVSVNKFEENRVSSSKYKSIRKIGNEIVETLAKLKSWNLLKFRFENLSRSKKFKVLIL